MIFDAKGNILVQKIGFCNELRLANQGDAITDACGHTWIKADPYGLDEVLETCKTKLSLQ